MENRLHDSFGTWKTDLRVIVSEILILHFPAFGERVLSTIFTFRFSTQGIYEENKK